MLKQNLEMCSKFSKKIKNYKRPGRRKDYGFWDISTEENIKFPFLWQLSWNYFLLRVLFVVCLVCEPLQGHH